VSGSPMEPLPKISFRADRKKIVQAINYFLERCKRESLTKRDAMKLLFFADKQHLQKYGRTITGDNYFAIWKGPIASKTLDAINGNLINSEVSSIKAYMDDFIIVHPDSVLQSKRSTDEDVFSDSDLEVLESVCEEYGSIDSDKLVDLAHHEKAYSLAWDNRGNSNSPVMVFENFFENLDTPLYQKAVLISEMT
jgi:uncharacterized phage-associated protein